MKNYSIITFLSILIFSVCSFNFIQKSYATPLCQDVWDAENYSKNAKLQAKWAINFIEKIPLNGSERILDVGSGDGTVTQYLAKRLTTGGTVVGLDNSIDMHRKSRQLLETNPTPNLRFELGDGSNLVYQNEFDLIVGFSSFHWLKNQKRALAQFRAALKPNGKIYLFFPMWHGRPRFAEAVDKVSSKPEWSTYFSQQVPTVVLSSPKRLISMIASTSLLLKRMEVVEVQEKFENCNAMRDWLLLWPTISQPIPPILQWSFISQIIDLYLESYPYRKRGEEILYKDYLMELELDRQF